MTVETKVTKMKNIVKNHVHYNWSVKPVMEEFLMFNLLRHFKLSATLAIQTTLSEPFLKIETKQNMLRKSCNKAKYLRRKLFWISKFCVYLYNLKFLSAHSHFETKYWMNLANNLGRDYSKHCTDAQLYPNRLINKSTIALENSYVSIFRVKVALESVWGEGGHDGWKYTEHARNLFYLDSYNR